MGLIVPSRRGFLAGFTALLAAPSIVRASNLMSLSVIKPVVPDAALSGFLITNEGSAVVYVGGLAILPGTAQMLIAPSNWVGATDQHVRPALIA